MSSWTINAELSGTMHNIGYDDAVLEVMEGGSLWVKRDGDVIAFWAPGHWTSVRKVLDE
jgi:hypothetical protein